MSDSNSDSSRGGCGVGCGSFFAIILSVALNKSILWALIHAVFGWLYVVYALVFRMSEIGPALDHMFH